MNQSCTHLDQASDVTPSADGCEDCQRSGGRWVHLRMCMSCGHVGCCDSSPKRHARAHVAAVQHPIVQSYEPGEDWWWCYVDELAFMVDGAPSYSHP
ncbi:MAG: UBP-type zinc finger domain-containing protein [Acidimicrobiales bacterium]